ncbi:MAG TPA: hypothetical protein VHZ78_11290 [Rhizomicrobium sp.]|jgi:iron complex transport system substrate-binding protein|nr:hypothetical protein [Rhizomicrobium sp.]
MIFRHRRAVCLLAAAMAAALPAAQAAPVRTASTGLCADQYVLLLADRSQIVSLSPQSQSALSLTAGRAKGIAQNRGAAEEFLAGDVKLVVTDDGGGPILSRVLPRFGIKIVMIPEVASFAAMEQSVRDIASALGQKARGDALVADIERRRAALARLAKTGPHPEIVYFRPDGGGGGAGTFVDAALQEAGFRNLQVRRGIPGWRGLPLEMLVDTPPQGIVTGFFDSAQHSAFYTFSYNPIFSRLAGTVPTMTLPGKYWSCSGPFMIDAAEYLAKERIRRFGARS